MDNRDSSYLPPIRIKAPKAEDESPQDQPKTRNPLLRLVKNQPKSVVSLLSLGWSAPNSGAAADYFRRALELDPENPVAKDGLEWALAESKVAAAANVKVATPDAIVSIPRHPEILIAAKEEIKTSPQRATVSFKHWTLKRAWQIPFFRNLAIALIYLLFLTTAETVTVVFDARTGLILHALALITLLMHSALAQRGPLRRFLITLTLAPLIRLLSLSLPLASMSMPFVYRYAVVGFPLLLAAAFTARAAELTPSRVNLSWRAWPLQVLLSTIGLGLGYVEYLILRPQPLIQRLDLPDVLVVFLILLIFTGFLEEFIFRGLLQATTLQLFGKSGIIYSAFLFGILHMGYFSLLDVLFAFTVGLFFSYIAMKSHSILGVSLAHGVTNITLYVLVPLLLFPK